MFYIDHWRSFHSYSVVDRQLISNDGLHLTRKGIRQLLQEIFHHVSSKMGCASFLPAFGIRCSRSSVNRKVHIISKNNGLIGQPKSFVPALPNFSSSHPKRVSLQKKKKEFVQPGKTVFPRSVRYVPDPRGILSSPFYQCHIKPVCQPQSEVFSSNSFETKLSPQLSCLKKVSLCNRFRLSFPSLFFFPKFSLILTTLLTWRSSL